MTVIPVPVVPILGVVVVVPIGTGPHQARDRGWSRPIMRISMIGTIILIV